MTEFEAIILRDNQAELILLMGEGLATHITIYLALVSAYLVVAFMAGRKLTTLQISIATFLYFVAYFLETIILAGLVRLIRSRRESFQEDYPSMDIGVVGDMGGLYILSALAIAVFVASLWFMWSVRHPKNE